MSKLTSYLNFDGDCEEAFQFYKKVFRSEFLREGIQRMKDAPGMADKLEEKEKNRVMHVSLSVGDDVLMGSDILPSMGHRLNRGNGHYISFAADSKEQAERIYNELSAGGEVEMELKEQFWGALFGSLTDKFGIKWMVNYEMQ